MTNRERLAAEIELAIDCAEGEPMQWGTDDCVLWCSDVLKPALGVDPMQPYRGLYVDERAGRELIGERGLVAAMSARVTELGWRRVAARDAQVGDVGLARTATGVGAVLKYRGRFWIGRVDRGVTLVPEDRVRLAWTVCA